jgi:hypothetical protein
MTEYIECCWCKRIYDPYENFDRFCSKKCRQEEKAYLLKFMEGHPEPVYTYRAKSKEELERDKAEELKASKRRKKEDKERQSWNANVDLLVFPFRLILLLFPWVMTIVFMRTIFPSLFPGLAKFVHAVDAAKTLFPTSVPEWIATVLFYAIPISPIGWAAWIVFGVAFFSSSALSNFLESIVGSLKK